MTCHCCQYLKSAQRNSVHIGQCHEQYSKREWTKLLNTSSVTSQLLSLLISKAKTFKQSVPVLSLNINKDKSRVLDWPSWHRTTAVTGDYPIRNKKTTSRAGNFFLLTFASLPQQRTIRIVSKQMTWQAKQTSIFLYVRRHETSSISHLHCVKTLKDTSRRIFGAFHVLIHL